MAAGSRVSFLLLCLVVIQTCLCFAQELPFQWEDQTPWQPRQQGRSRHRLQQREECDLWSLTAAEPSSRFQSEGGVTEYWDPNQQQLRCAGVVVVRHVIEPQGLLLPAYGNAPHITYIIQGRGIFGATIPGCPQTFQSESRGERHSGRFTDEHEKIRRFYQGDAIAMPTGVTRWVYNDGDSRLISVSFYDISSFQNQLDGDLRKFYLAGTRQLLEPRGERRIGGHLQLEGHNIFSGFDQELLADALGVNVETVKKLQGLNDNRGNIVRVDRSLRLLSPEYEEEERRSEERRRINGLETTFCNLRLTHNIDTPSETDIYNPRGGRMTTVNSQKLPILAHLRLSAQRVVLYENAILAPSWTVNAHSILYVTRGRGRIQVVRDNGRLVLDQEVQEGQLLVIPQNYVAVKKASREGLEYVAFKTNDNAISSPLAGRTSILRSLPVEVLANSYLISRETARQLKHSRRGVAVFGPAAATMTSRRDIASEDDVAVVQE